MIGDPGIDRLADLVLPIGFGIDRVRIFTISSRLPAASSSMKHSSLLEYSP